jgi:hypothetical protein
MASYRGIQKSSNLQDKLHRRIDKWEQQQERLTLPEQTWSPQRWQHHKKKEQPRDD